MEYSRCTLDHPLAAPPEEPDYICTSQLCPKTQSLEVPCGTACPHTPTERHFCRPVCARNPHLPCITIKRKARERWWRGKSRDEANGKTRTEPSAYPRMPQEDYQARRKADEDFAQMLRRELVDRMPPYMPHHARTSCRDVWESTADLLPLYQP
jgi:hypothetical protein